MIHEMVARTAGADPVVFLKEQFRNVLPSEGFCDAIFVDSGFSRVIGITGLPKFCPAALELLKNDEISAFLLKQSQKSSIMVLFDSEQQTIRIFIHDEKTEEVKNIQNTVRNSMTGILADSSDWAGKINASGEHVIDLKKPSPGPHFYVNLLLGNRVDYPFSLQTTPKSVVDRLGRGSFRSHAATQVLATRWDIRQEENGFPANRQFYLTENGRKIFYSADIHDTNIDSAKCVHAQNFTRISYYTRCGLYIERLIFLLPQTDGLPLAVESQRITVRNLGGKDRNIRLIFTGMFGPAAPHALQEDVLYSNIIMQSRILREKDGSILTVGNDYYPQECREDQRFHTTMAHMDGKAVFPKEFCQNYNEFFGNGTLENPENLSLLSNRFSRKGPGFFAVGVSFTVKAGEKIEIDNFTGLVSKKTNPSFGPDAYRNEITRLIKLHRDPLQTEKDLKAVRDFYNSYRSYLTVKTGDEKLDSYFNHNLPFQVLYQTFVSRSFCQTQKGYREIGFREIQDVYASMYYLVSMGKADTVKHLLKEWCEKVFEFGYAYHNFFWAGKEPGKWSDDALWFVQALYRYINLTGDIGILDEECAVAGINPIQTRKIFETVQAIITYSAEISVGKHGLPLLDNADWNDCLKLDTNFIDGITKERLYKEQVEKSGRRPGEPFRSVYSESVMNAFLLKLAVDEVKELADKKGDSKISGRMKNLSLKIYGNIQKHAWKKDFFARVLFNRYQNNEYTYLGADGDGLSAEPLSNGSYFINSFSWAVLSGSATEEQIRTIADTLEKKLKTPYGLRLMTLADLDKIAQGTAAGHYFPGDRENGAVFKHASMMATAALFKAAQTVSDPALAKHLAGLGYWMINLALPYKTMEDPFKICGNPRFCTQYNNSDTGEAIGPMLSGTSTWLTLCFFAAFGVEYTSNGIVLDPILKEEQNSLEILLNTGKASYRIRIKKDDGFRRVKDGSFTVTLDGKAIPANVLPLLSDGAKHKVEMRL